MFIFNKKKKSKDVNDSNKIKNFEFSFLSDGNTKNTEEEKTKTEKKIIKKKKFFTVTKLVMFFVVIFFLYVLYSFLKTLNNNNQKIIVYEVNNGTLTKSTKEKGFIFRDENVYRALDNGYINFLTLSNSKISKGSLVYIINDNDLYDEKDIKLTNRDYESIRKTIRTYLNAIDYNNFSYVYNYNNNLKNLTKELSTIKLLSNISSKEELTVKAADYAKKSGVISFNIDGYENYKKENFSEKLFNSSNRANSLAQNTTVRKDDDVYKIIENPDYQIVFRSDNDYSELVSKKKALVSFSQDDIKTEAKISNFYGDDGKFYYVLTLNKYLESFIDRRIVEFELLKSNKTGLKIPIKSLTEKNCFKIPRAYVRKDDLTDDDIIVKIIGNEKVVVPINISKSDSEFFYVSIEDNISGLKYNDRIADQNNNELNISEVVPLIGVYSLNKGYAIFKNVDIIERNNEYALIERNTYSGISIYDRIALDASFVHDGDLIS